MNDSLPQPAPDNADKPADIPAESVPKSSDDETTIEETEEIDIPDDPEALAADREGFRFIAIGFACFFVIIVVCGSIVALVMKSMGI